MPWNGTGPRSSLVDTSSTSDALKVGSNDSRCARRVEDPSPRPLRTGQTLEEELVLVLEVNRPLGKVVLRTRTEVVVNRPSQ